MSTVPLDTTPLAIGGSAAGEFDKSHDLDWFKVALTTGQTYLFTMSSAAQGDGNITDFSNIDLNIVTADGTFLDWLGYRQPFHSPVIEFTATQTGDYYLVPQQGGNAPYAATYHVSAAVAAADDFTDGPGGAGVLTIGTAVSGVSEVAGDRDWFKFHADEGQHYSFDGQVVAGQTSVLNIRIYDASGTLLTPGGTDGFDALASGDYYVSVEGDGRGAYTLLSSDAADDYGATNADAGAIAPGRPVSGHIDYLNDVDRFAVAVQAGSFYTIEVAPNPAGSVSLQWLDAAGNGLTAASVKTASGAWDYTVQATTTGIAYIDARAYGVPSLAYALSELAPVKDDYGNTIATAAAIQVGAGVSGVLQAGLDIDMFKVALQAGVTYTLTLQPQALQGAMTLTLRDADGHDLRDYAVTATNAQNFFTFTPTASGSYYLAASGTAAGTYALSATATIDDAGANAASAGKLAVGAAPLHGELEKGGGDIDWYAVHLDAGSTYWFTLSGQDEAMGTLTSGSQLRLVNADGNALASTAGVFDLIQTAPLLPFMASSTGTYYVEVTNPGRDTGTYQLQAQIGVQDDYGNDARHAMHIGVGKTQTGVIEFSTDQDVFAIDVVAGATYGLMLTAAKTGDAVSLGISDSNGVGVQISTVGATQLFTAVSTGTYYVTVHGDQYYGSTGQPYTLTSVAYGVDDFAGNAHTTGVLPVAGSIQGRIDFPGDVDYVRVHLEAGVSYAFELQGNRGGAGTLDTATASFSLYGEGTNNEVASASHFNGSEPLLRYTPTVTGDYYAAVSDYQPSVGLSYTLVATQTSGDLAPPVLTSATPATGLGLSDDIRLSFDESITLTSTNSAGVALTDANGQTVLLTASNGGLSLAGHTLTIDPYLNLAPGMHYTLQIIGVSDLAGNVYGPTTLAFDTVAAVSQGGDGNDYLISKADGKTLDGGAGIDTVYYDNRQVGGSVAKDASGNWIVQNDRGTPDKLVNVERVVFASNAVALDIDGHAGQAYRLYQAAFDRAPDQGGLGYWMNALDKGTSLHDVADSFVHSAEFATLYGAATTDAQFLTLLYNNVLHRAPDAGGAAYWTDAFQHGLTRPDALTSFSESAENQAAVIGQIGNGIAYTPYHA